MFKRVLKTIQSRSYIYTHNREDPFTLAESESKFVYNNDFPSIEERSKTLRNEVNMLAISKTYLPIEKVISLISNPN